jgi:hypothetical protein
MSKGYKRTTKRCKILEQELIAKSNENNALMDEPVALKKSKECKEIEQELKALRKSFDELEASRECLKEDHEDLKLLTLGLRKPTPLYLSSSKKRTSSWRSS